MNLSGILRISFIVNILLIFIPAFTSIILIRKFDLNQIENYNFILAVLTSSSAIIFSSFIQGNISSLILGRIKFFTIFIWNSGLYIVMNILLLIAIYLFDFVEPFYWFLILSYLFLISLSKLIINIYINLKPKIGLLIDLLNASLPFFSVNLSDSVLNFIFLSIFLKSILIVILIINFRLYDYKYKKFIFELKVILKNGIGYLSDSFINITSNTLEKIVLRNINNFSFTISNLVNKATGPISSIVANNNFWLVLFSRKNKFESLNIIYSYSLIVISGTTLLIVIYKCFEYNILNLILYIFNQKISYVQIKDPIIFTLMGIGFSSIFNVFKRYLTALTNFKLMRRLSYIRVFLIFLFLFLIVYLELNWTIVFLAWSIISFILTVILSFIFYNKMILILVLSILFNTFVYFNNLDLFFIPLTLFLFIIIFFRSFSKFKLIKW